jgi:hypothetical protein
MIAYLSEGGIIMKRFLIIPVILFSSFVSGAKENPPEQSSANKEYRECVAVSLFTKEGREVNSMIENKRMITQTNIIPEGWSVIGVTTKTEADVDTPYLVICH